MVLGDQLINSRIPGLLGRRLQERGFDRIARQLRQLRARQSEPFGDREEIVLQIAAEVRRIIGIHGDAQALVQQRLEVVIGHLVEYPQPHVRQRTHRERHALARQACNQCRVLHATHAMVDAPHLQQIQGFLDVGGRSFLPGVGHRQQAQAPGAFEHGRELRGWMARFGGIEPDSREAVAPRQRLLQRLHRIGGRQMAQETQDQPVRDSGPRLRLTQCPGQPLHDHGHRHPAGGVGLRIKENLGVDDAVGVRPLQIGAGHGVEIIGVPQHVGASVVDVQEGLQVGKIVCRTQLDAAAVGQVDAVLGGQCEYQLRLQRALYVHMQFCFGQRPDEVGNGERHGDYDCIRVAIVVSIDPWAN